MLYRTMRSTQNLPVLEASFEELDDERKKSVSSFLVREKRFTAETAASLIVLTCLPFSCSACAWSWGVASVTPS